MAKINNNKPVAQRRALWKSPLMQSQTKAVTDAGSAPRRYFAKLSETSDRWLLMKRISKELGGGATCVQTFCKRNEARNAANFRNQGRKVQPRIRGRFYSFQPGEN